MAKRPLLITVLGALYALMGILIVLAAIALFFVDLSTIDSALADAGALLGGGVLVFGLVYLIIGYGFLNGWTIMWYLGIIFSAIGALGSLLTIPAGLVSLVINVVILYYLFRPQVKSFFKV